MLKILDCTPIAQFAIDLEHRVTLWNRTCEELTGYTSRQMVGTRDHWKPFYPYKRPVLADLIVDNDIGALEKLYQGAGISQSEIIPSAWEGSDFFENIAGKDRHFYFLAAPIRDSQGKMVGAVETVQDITQQVLAQDNLRESEMRYRILTENVVDGVALLQEESFKVVNNAFAQIFGYNATAEILDTRPIDLIADPDKAVYRSMQQAVYENRFNTQVVELRCLKADGREFWIESCNNVITWESKPGVLVTVRDITHRKYQEMVAKEETHELRNENKRLRSKIKNTYGLGQIMGKSRPMQAVYDNILRAASSDANAIIYGESGTGKELVARAIHEMSDRGDQAFIAVNCGAIPENLFESEFFGYKKGAFTGATIDKSGFLESAKGGSLFLDEIGEIPMNMQVKLLRALEGGGFTPIGSTRSKKPDVRIIAATNRDLKDHVKKGFMREDFFYRIHVIPIRIPPLRERMEDLPLLVYHFLSAMAENPDKILMPDRALKAMQAYEWPGNVRELQNVIQRYVTFNSLDFLNLSNTGQQTTAEIIDSFTPDIHEGFQLSQELLDFEKRILLKAMQQEKGNRTHAAVALGLNRRSLQRKLQKHQIA